MRKTLKILHVISNFGVGGAEVWLIALLRYYKEHSHELGVEIHTDIFLTNGFRDCLDEEAERLGAKLIYARYSRKTLPSFIRKWRRTLATGCYDAIHDHQEFTAGWHFLFGTGHLSLVRAVHLHNAIGHQISYSKGLLRRQTINVGNFLVARNATHLLSTSRALISQQGFDELSAARHLPKKAVYCGFDPLRFAGAAQVARQDVAKEFGLLADSKVMLFVGRLDSHPVEEMNVKNPGFCLDVARICAMGDPNFFCLIAGGGQSMLDLLQERINGWNLEFRIRLLGARTDVPRLMLAADILLFPSLAEGLGMVAVEAQAAGLPVIASDAVPRECQVVEGMVDFMPLSAGVESWAKLVLEKVNASKPDHHVANQAVMNSPFSIANSAKSLLDIYCGDETQPARNTKQIRRVLSLDPAGLLWGSERALLDFIGVLPGFDSACCCPPKGPLIGKLFERKIRSFPNFQANLHLRGAGAKALALLGLLRALWTYRPDILHVNQAGATRIAMMACRMFKIPCVAHVRLLEDVEYLGNLCPSPKHLKGLIAISQPIAELIQAQPNLRKVPCRVLLDAFRPTFESEIYSSAANSVPTWDFVCVGRIEKYKGQELLIQALHILAQQGIVPRVAFVGEMNECGTRLEERVAELGLNGSVEFAGHQDAVNPFLAKSKWLVCPSRYEALGRVLFEAWDVGIPVIAGEFSGGAAASVTGSGGGLLFSDWTPASLAITLAQALEKTPQEAQKSAMKGRAWLLESTDPEEYAASIAGLFIASIHTFNAEA